MSYIEITNLVKSYNEEAVVLNNLTLAMEKGTQNTLLGPSGCGKSTLLRTIAGLESIDSGTIMIDGRIINDLPPKDRNLGMVFQHYALFPNMTVMENVKFGLQMKKLPSSDQQRQAGRMLELVGLTGKEKAYPRELSGGQQQRVALARSLVTNPSVLLLDEPLSALDAQIRGQLRHLIKDIQRELGVTVVFVTHDQEEAMSMSDYVFVMDNGNIVQRGTVSDIYRHPENAFVANFIGNYNVFERKPFAQLINQSTENDYTLFAIRPETLSLDPLPGNSIITMEGVVYRTTMLGTLLRSEIVVGEQHIIVDQLNRSKNIKDEGERVTLFLDSDDVIKIK